ncbi:dihydrolipoamide dehydrogenase [Lampropedia cohaerens]|uniref:Dihydrolipoyl dehydrogenase n=1 Tax=Lampropedia cohaerens TaxID=1610491 RepID=A0A0U1PWP4_9BURK|nr:dihydrolipoyl dehydrogenase [Lampropedia cohaerens]KKW66939.1 dihydrolipoamide dehydrogenase [Lampropedia cohaerens]
MQTTHTQLLVLGGGPGGYVAAIRAGQLGIRTTLIEAQALGGTCLNIGCIPSKALIHAANEYAHAKALASAGGSHLGLRIAQASLDLAQTIAWKDGIVQQLTGGVAALLKRQQVEVIQGWGQIVDGKTVDVQDGHGQVTHRIHCDHLLLATGSVPVEIPALPFDGKRIVSSTEALSPREVPKRLVVLGGGYIGLELGTVYRKLGAQVHIVEAADRILPGYDGELTGPVQTQLARLGVVLHLGYQAIAAENAGDDQAHLRVHLRQAGHAQAETMTLEADQVLVAAGRRPRTDGMRLESLHLTMQGQAVQVDTQCRTSMRNVWAIGDITGDPMLAHRAMAQGEMVAEIISGKNRRFAPAQIPAVCFTDPEIVSVGLSPAAASAAGHATLTAQFPFAANGRAMTLQDSQGFVRVVARRNDHRILGWQAVGRQVAELATAFSQSLEMGAYLEDVAHTIHAHPTLGEAVQEAAQRALGQALHI